MSIVDTMKTVTGAVWLVLAASGCATLDGPSRVEVQARHAADIGLLRQQTAALEQRIDALESVREETYRQLDQIRHALRAIESDSARQRNELTAAIQAESSARDAMRADLTRSLSERIAEIMRTQVQPPAPLRAESGYEHVVRQGETLSEIARAYGVSMNAIIRANRIERPDALRVGQKLFIPD